MRSLGAVSSKSVEPTIQPHKNQMDEYIYNLMSLFLNDDMDGAVTVSSGSEFHSLIVLG